MAYEAIYTIPTLTGAAEPVNTTTLRVQFPVSTLTSPTGVGKVRVTFIATPDDPFQISAAYIGHRNMSGDYIDFATTPVQLKFSGGNTFSLSAGGSIVSDDATFTWDRTSDIIISFYDDGVAGQWIPETDSTGVNTALLDSANQASTVDVTAGSYIERADTVAAISKIESDSVAPTVILIAGDRILDFGLGKLNAECDKVFVCSQQPTTYTEATSTYALGNKNWGAGNAFNTPAAKSGGGRQVTSVAITDGNITASGTVAAWAAVDTSNSRLLASGNMTGGKAVTNGQVFTLSAMTFGIPNA